MTVVYDRYGGEKSNMTVVCNRYGLYKSLIWLFYTTDVGGEQSNMTCIQQIWGWTI